MASSNIVYFKSKTYKDGSHPVAIRLIFDRKPRYVFLESIQEVHWNATLKEVTKSHPSYKRLNNLIKTKALEADDLLLEYEKGNSALTPEKIFNQLNGKKNAETFFDYLADYIEEYVKRNKHSLATGYESIGKNIWNYINKGSAAIKKTKGVKDQEGKQYSKDRVSVFREKQGNRLAFHEITDSFLRGLSLYLTVDCEIGERGIYNHMNIIRAMYNRAIKDGVAKSDNYPFRSYTLTMPESEKIPLDKEEVLRFEGVTLEEKTDTWIHAKNAWLFAFSFGGKRIADVLLTRWDEFLNGRHHYVMNKNNKPVSLEIPERAKAVLKYYKKEMAVNKGYIFPALRNANLDDPIDVERKIKNAVRIYNIWLKKIARAAKIEKDLSTHISRHSFGNIAGDKISAQLLQAIYKHSDIRTTMNYQQHWMNKEKLDDAVKSVVNF